MDYYNAVKLFHETFKHPAPDHVTLSPYGDAQKDQNLRDLRIELIREEVEELEEALAAKDIVEIADAGADILYVCYGAQVAFGLPQTITGLDTPRKHKTASYQTGALFLLEPIETALKSLRAAIVALNTDDVNASLTTIIYHTLILTNECGIDMQAVFAEVQRSNMSKLDENGQPIFRADGKILKSSTWSPPDLSFLIL